MNNLNGIEIDRIIEMAWEDRTTFDAIKFQFGLKEQDVINLMRKEMKPKSFKMWRERVQGRKRVHAEGHVLGHGHLVRVHQSERKVQERKQ